jgi:hypothetical protein
MRVYLLLLFFLMVSCSVFKTEKKDNTPILALAALALSSSNSSSGSTNTGDTAMGNSSDIPACKSTETTGGPVTTSNPSATWNVTHFGNDTAYNSTIRCEPKLSTIVSSYTVPFDFSKNDLLGPSNWNIKYGTKPQVVLYPNGDGNIDIAWQNTTDAANPTIIITSVKREDSSKYKATRHFILSSLGYLGGLTKDDSGNYYLMTARNESLQSIISPNNNAPWARKGVVAIVKIDNSTQTVSYSTNVLGDASLTDATEFRHIFSPMVAGTSRMAFGNGIVVSFFAKHLGYDTSISARHQNGLVATLDTSTGTEITGSNAYSHSFDQRVFYDSDNKRFITLELGDAYDRAIGLATYSIASTKGTRKPFKVYLIKGTTGENNTYTRLGGVVNTSKGYLVLFATEKETTVATTQATYPTNLALVRMTKTLSTTESSTTNANYDSSFGGEAHTVTQAGKSVTSNGVKWLTSYTNITSGSAERPKIVSLTDGSIIILWEEWTKTTYTTTKAMLIDADGNVTKQATDIGKIHIPLGDDVVAVCAPDKSCLEAGWVSGDSTNKSINLYKVDKNLTVKTIAISE